MDVVNESIVGAGQPWTGIVEPGQHLRITDLEGRQGVDFLCYNADNPLERYHAPNTLKAAGTLRLTTGHTLYSDEARPIMTMVADSVGGYHDTIGGCCSAHSNEMLYGVKDCPGCRENFLTGLEQHGLGRRDIVPNVNFFCNVPVVNDGELAERSFVPLPNGGSHPSDHVELRAEMRVLVVISNCPQMNNPCNDGQPTSIRIEIFEAG
ncbi:MAG: urea carboxylase [Rhodospirillaceae bacterium]|nr:urea carboxylase [Rhodospirillaceae bacterium]